MLWTALGDDRARRERLEGGERSELKKKRGLVGVWNESWSKEIDSEAAAEGPALCASGKCGRSA